MSHEETTKTIPQPTAHERAVALAHEEANEALAEFPNGIEPSAKDMKTIVLKFVLWLVVAATNMLLLFQLAMGITHNFVVSAAIALLFVAMLAGCSVWLTVLFERHQAKLITEARFRISIILTVVILLVLCLFASYFSSVRAEIAHTDEMIRLQNTITTLEANAATASLDDGDALALAVDKGKLASLQTRIEQETALYAVAECLTLPAELWLGMALPLFLHIRRVRGRYEPATTNVTSRTERAKQEQGKGDVVDGGPTLVPQEAEDEDWVDGTAYAADVRTNEAHPDESDLSNL
ncbi:MAG: G-protein coupled receptor [Coriobacteriales bacterium]|jgi:hypothetical protein|nr:G-protein coupled receptor [Coriobacteriales bacterium]